MPTYGFKDYHVGIICALSIELSAAMLLLDGPKHPEVRGKPSTDKNSYVYGTINGHNVVMTVLKETGTSPASVAATSMSSTHPNLKFGLFMGIGGGIPYMPSEDSLDKVDIRLGDVVVSFPERTFGGVVMYQKGKDKTNSSDGSLVFEKTGTLDKPPELLLATVNMIETEMRNYGGIIMEIFDSIRSGSDWARLKPARKKELQYPGTHKDLLFDAEYIHPDSNYTCENANCLEGDAEIHRDWTEREELGFEPFVHKGTIASDNKVVRNSQVRDALRKEYGAKCVETEAAGIMDSFPCLVVRGISDYADSHKNDEWHAYAAFTAAAYCKKLLQSIQPESVLELPTANAVLNGNQPLAAPTQTPQPEKPTTPPPVISHPRAPQTPPATPKPDSVSNPFDTTPPRRAPQPRVAPPTPPLEVPSRPLAPVSTDSSSQIQVGTNIAGTAPSTNKRLLYFQNTANEILQSVHKDGVWSTGKPTGLRAKEGSPLAVVSWKGGDEIRLFCVDEDNHLREWCLSQKNGPRWYSGSLNDLQPIVLAHNSSIAAIQWDEFNPQIRVYYQEPSNNIREYSASGNTWSPGGLTLTLATAGTGIAATYSSQAPNRNGDAHIRIFYQDQKEGSIWEHHWLDAKHGWRRHGRKVPRNDVLPLTSLSALAWTDSRNDRKQRIRVFWQNRAGSIRESQDPGWNHHGVGVLGVAETARGRRAHFCPIGSNSGEDVRVFYHPEAEREDVSEWVKRGKKWGEESVGSVRA